MDYLKGLTVTNFELGAMQAEADMTNETTDHNPYMDGLVTNPTVLENVTPTVQSKKPDKVYGQKIVKSKTYGKFDMARFKSILYDIESGNGTIKDREGSQYSGIAQLGINERTPILKQLGITDAQYKSSRDLQRKAADIWVANLASSVAKKGYEVNDMNMWVAHNQGLGGLGQILRGEVSSGVLGRIRKQAGMSKSSTVEDYLSYYRNRFK